MLGRDRVTASGSGYLYMTVNNLSNNKFSYNFTHAIDNNFMKQRLRGIQAVRKFR
jgi:hypothetical protein